jgi:hypothetical protein
LAATNLEHGKLVDFVVANSTNTSLVVAHQVLYHLRGAARREYGDYNEDDYSEVSRQLLELDNSPNFTGPLIVGVLVSVFIMVVCLFLTAGFGKPASEGCAVCLVSACGPNQFSLAVQKYFPITIRNAKDKNGKSLDVKKRLMEKEAKRRGHTMDDLNKKFPKGKGKKKKVKKKKVKAKKVKVKKKGGKGGKGKKSKMKAVVPFEDKYFAQKPKKKGNDAKWKGGRKAAYA